MSFRVLHIEDSEIQIQVVQSLLAKALKEEDYVYKACRTLEEARAVLDEGCLDVVLVDLQLPDSSGIDSVRVVKGMCPNVPIVVLTGTDDVEVAKATIHAGASTYVRKSDISALPLILILTVEKWDMEKELKDRCQLYDSVVNLSPDYICRFRPNGIITFVNTSFANLVLRADKDVVGTKICDYLDSETQKSFTQAGHTLDSICKIADGGEFLFNGRWISWRASAIRDKHGRVKEIQCVGRDTTYRHRRTQELLTMAQQQMSEKQRQIGARTDQAFAILLETDKKLASIEGG